jgi:hypothetical protein
MEENGGDMGGEVLGSLEAGSRDWDLVELPAANRQSVGVPPTMQQPRSRLICAIMKTR